LDLVDVLWFGLSELDAWINAFAIKEDRTGVTVGSIPEQQTVRSRGKETVNERPLTIPAIEKQFPVSLPHSGHPPFGFKNGTTNTGTPSRLGVELPISFSSVEGIAVVFGKVGFARAVADFGRTDGLRAVMGEFLVLLRSVGFEGFSDHFVSTSLEHPLLIEGSRRGAESQTDG
jgi:hypothetical protein